MTDLPDPAADAAAATTEGETPASGDPELAALVRPVSHAARDGDPELAALVRPSASGATPALAAAEAAEPEPSAGPAAAVAGASVAGEPATEVGAADPASPAAAEPSEPGSEAEAIEPTEAVVEDAPDATPQAAPADDAGTAVADGPETVPDATAELPVAAAVVSPPAGEAVDAAPAPRRRRSLALRFAVAFLLGVGLVAGVGAGALYAWGQQYDGRILPGVHVDTTDLSGLTSAEAQAAIAKAYASLGAGAITLTGPAGPVTIAYSAINRGPDTAAILDAALAAGRGGELLANLIGAPQAAMHGVTVGSAVTYDRQKLAAAVDAIASTLYRAPVDAAVTSGTDGTFTIVSAVDGRAVDKAALLAALDQKLTALDTPADITVGIPMTTVAPKAETTAADSAKAAGDRMAADLVLTRGTDTWTINGADLRPLVSFAMAGDGTITPVFNQSGLGPLVNALANKINQTARDATLKLVNGHVVVAGTSREGRTLNVAATEAAIASTIAARQAGSPDEPTAVVVKAVAPKLTTEQAKQYAPKMAAISRYSIYYWSLINNHWGGNIEGPARKINGTVIPAGGIFDFWKVVGDLHKVPGVGPGNAIEGGKITVTGAFGGGICTTSTTLFNAAIHAGMVPLARQNHDEFISRYPPGLDATVWIVGNTKQTMSFKNDTTYPILIQSIVQTTGSLRWLTFRIWSVPNGRTVSISNRIIQPGQRAVDTVVKDPTKPVGWSYRVNTPVNGARVWVTVTIKDHGKVHWRKTFYSNYPAVNGVLQVGSKGA